MIEQLRRLAETELKYAAFNAQRTNAKGDSSCIVLAAEARAPYLIDTSRPENPYYNRAVVLPDNEGLDTTIQELPAQIQSVELPLTQQSESHFATLLDLGFMPHSSLHYLGAVAAETGVPKIGIPETANGETAPFQHEIRQLGDHQAEYFLGLLEQSGVTMSHEKRTATRQFYCTKTFRCFVAYTKEGQATGWATMFVTDDVAFLANAYTISDFRRRGYHSSLLSARLAKASQLGLKQVYTDVEPMSQSYQNCTRSGCTLLSTNLIWVRKKSSGSGNG